MTAPGIYRGELLTPGEAASLQARLDDAGCTCEEVELLVDRERRTIGIRHDQGCPLLGQPEMRAIL